MGPPEMPKGDSVTAVIKSRECLSIPSCVVSLKMKLRH